MQIDRETLEEVEAALAAAEADMETLLDMSANCGDPNYECPMQDAYSPHGTADIHKRVVSALARLRKAMEDGNQPQTYDYYGCTPMEAKDG